MPKKLQVAYGFDDVALIPASVTVNPEETDISFKLGKLSFELPVMASAMDAVVNPKVAGLFAKLGGLAVLNLEGIYTRYENPEEALNKICTAPKEDCIALIQKVYSEPIKEHLIEKCIHAMRKEGAVAAVACTPARALKLYTVMEKAGAEILFVQSSVTTAEYKSKQGTTLSFKELCKKARIPVVAGNTVTYEASLALMKSGVEAILVGVGPGAACTTRRVLGIGVPQITAIMDVARARADFLKKNKRRVSVIGDGGMRNGGDVAKAFAAGADAVMLGSPFASSAEAPGRGYHWGMATGHAGLPRGTRIHVGTRAPLEQILTGPSTTDDGSLNLFGALRHAMGVCGAKTIREMQNASLVIAPSFGTEGKAAQRDQHMGMGK